MAVRSVNIASICAGYDGIGLGVQACWPEARTIVYVEREPFAAANLVAKMEAGALAPAPVWSDLSTFDGRPWRGKLDLVTAGLPCQPYSTAGKQRGHADERAIWPEFIRVVGECRPALVFMENVPAFLAWAREPLTELCRMGYTVEEPLLLSASDVGANHRRERVWILAHAQRTESRAGTIEGSPSGERRSGLAIGGEDVAHSSSIREQRLPIRSRRPLETETDPTGAGADAPDPFGTGLEVGQRIGGDDGSERATAKRSGQDGVCDANKQHLHGRCPAGHKGQARPADRRGGWWTVEPDMGRVAHGIADRVDRLRLLGNGVVSLQAAVAFRILADRAFGEEGD